MFVLLDMEWIETESKTREITQMAAARVDELWKPWASFAAIVRPMSLSSCDPAHIGFNGYPLERFENGEAEADAIRRFSKWLREDDALCVWHHDTGDVLAAAWLAVFQERMPLPILQANRKVRRSVQNGVGSHATLYEVAESQGIPMKTPHCSVEDVLIMRRLFAFIDLPQKKLQKEYASAKQAGSAVDRNRAILAKTQYNYIFVPGSAVFHTRDCPRVLRAKKIEGCVYYKTAEKSRRPCKICKPAPNVQVSIPRAPKVKSPKATPGPKAAPGSKAAPESTVNYKEIIEVRLLGGATVKTRRGNIIGFCHNLTHPGKLTRSILDEHRCLAKHCPFLEKYEGAPFWVEREKKRIAKSQAKQHKKEKQAVMIKLRNDFQRHANFTDSELDVIRVEHPNPRTYTIFYVSDNRFADWNRFPEFLDALKKSYEHSHIILRHIKDLDGHFVTRDEYYSRKR